MDAKSSSGRAATGIPKDSRSVPRNFQGTGKFPRAPHWPNGVDDLQGVFFDRGWGVVVARRAYLRLWSQIEQNAAGLVLLDLGTNSHARKKIDGGIRTLILTPRAPASARPRRAARCGKMRQNDFPQTIPLCAEWTVNKGELFNDRN